MGFQACLFISLQTSLFSPLLWHGMRRLERKVIVQTGNKTPAGFIDNHGTGNNVSFDYCKSIVNISDYNFISVRRACHWNAKLSVSFLLQNLYSKNLTAVPIESLTINPF